MDRIVNQLVTIYHQLESDSATLLKIAPIYILDYQKSFDYNVNELLDSISINLEREHVFMPNMNANIVLNVQDSMLVSFNNNDSILFTDYQTQNPFTFTHYMKSVQYENVAKNGIVCIYIDSDISLDKSVEKWIKLLNQMQAYKDRYIFIVVVEHEDVDFIQNMVKKKFFYSTIECEFPPAQEYIRYFAKRLSDHNIVLYQEDINLMVEDFFHQKPSSFKMIDRMVDETVWNTMLKFNLKDTDVHRDVSKYVVSMVKSGLLKKYSNNHDVIDKIGF